MIRLEGPYRQSQINDYLSCPQALLLRLEGVEPLFRSLGLCRGAAVHAAIFHLHRQQNWQAWQVAANGKGTFRDPVEPGLQRVWLSQFSTVRRGSPGYQSALGQLPYLHGP